jgi:hypothetical protein
MYMWCMHGPLPAHVDKVAICMFGGALMQGGNCYSMSLLEFGQMYFDRLQYTPSSCNLDGD